MRESLPDTLRDTNVSTRWSLGHNDGVVLSVPHPYIELDPLRANFGNPTFSGLELRK